jgi:hypothetical protein
MASLQDRLRQQIKERKAKKVKSDLNNEVMKAEKQNKKNAGLRVYGKINKTTEKKLKKKGLTDAEIKRLKKQDIDNKGRFGATVKNKKTFFRNDKPAASKSKSAPRAVDKGGRLSARGSEGFKPTNTRRGPDMSTVNKKGEKGGGGADRPRRKGPSGPTMTSMGRPSTGPKPRNKDPKVNLKKRGPSGPSMTGFYGGGTVGNTSMGRVRVAKPGNINGIAKRGLTRAKHR